MYQFRWPPWRPLTREERVVAAVHHLSKIAIPAPGRRDGSFTFAHYNTTPDYPFTLHFTFGPVAAEIISREDKGYDGAEFQ